MEISSLGVLMAMVFIVLVLVVIVLCFLKMCLDEVKLLRMDEGLSEEKKLIENSEIYKKLDTSIVNGWNEFRHGLQDMVSVFQDRTSQVLTESSRIVLENEKSNRIIVEKINALFQVLNDNQAKHLREVREEISKNLEMTRGAITQRLESIRVGMKDSIESQDKILKKNADELYKDLRTMQNIVKENLSEIRVGNEKKLEEIKIVVNEKLQDTMEKRLGHSFKQVTEQLESVYKGIGEMKNLANGVGDLKRVLTNVKTRGTWAEVQLGAILEQILAPSQFGKNVRVKPRSREQVEFAILLPGPNGTNQSQIYLPIDSKFPQEDYLRLQEASEALDAELESRSKSDLLRTIKKSAKDICDKYVNPPQTTDFAIMFLATEGLYAEVLAVPGFMEEIQREYKVVIAGPATLVAILNSLRMGFQTLAIQKQASEVWQVLSAVKTEFGKFYDILGKVGKQIDNAGRAIAVANHRAKQFEKKLKHVEALPESQAQEILSLSGGHAIESDRDNEDEAE